MTGTFVHRARLALAMLAVAAAFGVAAGTARASITFVASATGATATTGATSFTIAAPTGITAGEAEIATISVAGSATVTAPSGWTQIINTPVGTSLRQVSFSHVAGSSEGTTTWTLSSSSVATGGIAAYSNVDTTTIVDASSSQTGTSGTTATVPSVTTNYNGDLVLGVGSFNNIGTLTASGSTTSRYSKSVTGVNGPTMLAEDTRLVTAGATSSQTITDNTTATAWIGQVITLKPATVAIAFVAAGSGATSSSGATSFTIAAPTGVAAGEVEIATISRQGTATVTPPSGWTQIIDTTVGTSLRQTSYWHIAGTSEGTTTWTLSASSVAAGGIAAYNNVDTTTIIDATAAQSGTSGTTATVPSVTTNYTGDVVLGVGSFNNIGTLTASGSTTSRYSVKVATTNGPDLLGEDASQATAGATT